MALQRRHGGVLVEVPAGQDIGVFRFDAGAAVDGRCVAVVQVVVNPRIDGDGSADVQPYGKRIAFDPAKRAEAAALNAEFVVFAQKHDPVSGSPDTCPSVS